MKKKGKHKEKKEKPNKNDLENQKKSINRGPLFSATIKCTTKRRRKSMHGR